MVATQLSCDVGGGSIIVLRWGQTSVVRSEGKPRQQLTMPQANRISQKFQWGNNQLVIPREGNLRGSDEQIATLPDRGDLPLFMGGG